MFGNYIQQKQNKTRVKKKHIINITHFEEDGNYFKTQITYRLSWQYVRKYDNVNIFTSDEYSWLVNSYNNRDTLVRGIEVNYEEYTGKPKTQTNRKVESVSISDEIFVSLPETHYSIDVDDVEYFRMRSISYNILDVGEVHWVQVQNRPALYINSIDTTAKFDGNSVLMYIHAKELKEILHNDIVLINKGNPAKKNEYVRKFVERIFDHTMMLYYINVSHGWKFEDITYQKLWNLSMVLLCQVKPFSNDFDWLKGVKTNYVRWLFERKAKNELDKGIKHYYFKLAKSKLVSKETRYCFPESMDKLKREMFKSMFPKTKTVHQEFLESRNQSIRNDYGSGLTIRQLSVKYSLSVGCIHRIISIP